MKLLNNDIVSSYWDSVGDEYSDVWKSGAKPWMSFQEAKFITDHVRLIDSHNVRCLDVGSGNGRILDVLLNQGFSKISSVDISGEMVDYLKNKFKFEKRIIDISKITNINEIKGHYDNITAIRVLKYNIDWRDNLNHLVDMLKPNGHLIFTIPNRKSINVFAKCPIKIYRTDISELKELLKNLPVEIVSIKTLFRLPDLMYSSEFLAKLGLVPFLENLLSRLLPETLGGKIFFVAVKKTQ